jgi:hypothetical protein
MPPKKTALDRRRDFIPLTGSIAASPLAVLAQQSELPSVNFCPGDESLGRPLLGPRAAPVRPLGRRHDRYGRGPLAVGPAICVVSPFEA